VSPRKRRSSQKKVSEKHSVGIPEAPSRSEAVFAAPPPVPNPVFAEPGYMQDPSQFKEAHASDKVAYGELDALQKLHEFKPLPFLVVDGVTEPVLKLSDTLGSSRS
jgi:hypothetical protein